MKKIKQAIVFFFILGLMNLLCGCYTHGKAFLYSFHPLTAKQYITLNDLRRTGVIIVRQGDRLRIIIPTDAYFDPQTTCIIPERIIFMKRLARFVNEYLKTYPQRMTVRVYGFTDRVFTRNESYQLSQDYAERIAIYLWRAGVPWKQMIIQGLGANWPIASNLYPAGTAMNRRIEIRIC